jgi:hypothetical protein
MNLEHQTSMATVVREYDVKVDSKRRLTLRRSEYTYWHAKEFDDGRVLLEPREIRAPETISARVLEHMDEAVRQMMQGNVGDEFDLSEVEDLINED